MTASVGPRSAGVTKPDQEGGSRTSWVKRVLRSWRSTASRNVAIEVKTLEAVVQATSLKAVLRRLLSTL